MASPEHLHGRLAAAAAQARWRWFSIICDCAWLARTVEGRLAAAATVARWRWFPIICDCAWLLQGTSTNAWRPRPPWLAGAGFRLFAIVPGISRVRPRTPGGRGHRGSLALVPDYLRLCLASPGHVHGRLAAAAAQARWRCFSIICDCAWVGPALSRARPRKPCGPSDARPVQCRGTAPSRPQAPRPRARCLGLAQAPRLGAQRRDTSSKTRFFFRGSTAREPPQPGFSRFALDTSSKTIFFSGKYRTRTR